MRRHAVLKAGPHLNITSLLRPPRLPPYSPGGNIHSFTALSPCAVLDVLTPPYAPSCGRDCTYYQEVFPPQLLDDQARPLMVPSEQIVSWVRWQQAQHEQSPPQQLLQQQEQQQEQQQKQQAKEQEQEQQLWRKQQAASTGAEEQQQQQQADDQGYEGRQQTGIVSNGQPPAAQNGSGPHAKADCFSNQHPWQLLGTQLPVQGMIVGLEPVAMPIDFVVDRGVYRGRLVRT